MEKKMDNIDISINDTSAVVESITEELEKLAIENGTSLEEEILKYNELDKEEVLSLFNISGCDCTIIKFDDSHPEMDTITFLCNKEDFPCILECALRYECELTSIKLADKSKFEATLQYDYSKLLL